MSVEHFSKANLLTLIKKSKAVSLMNKEELAILTNFLKTASKTELIRMFVLFKSEAAEISRLEDEFMIKSLKTLDDFVTQTKGEIERIRREERLQSEEEKRAQEYQKMENEILSELNKL